MKKRFRVLQTGAGLEALLNELYMDGYVLHTATDTAVIMECFAVTDTDMRRQKEKEEQAAAMAALSAQRMRVYP